jgi:hypothetical protein
MTSNLPALRATQNLPTVRTSRALATHTPSIQASPVRGWSRGQIVGVALFAAFIAAPTAVAILSTYQP